MQPSELEHITPGQFNLMREGYEQDQIYEWERSRFIAYWVYTMAGKVSNETMTIEEFRPLTQKDLAVTSKSTIPEYTKQQEAYLNKLFNPSK